MWPQIIRFRSVTAVSDSDVTMNMKQINSICPVVCYKDTDY